MMTCVAGLVLFDNTLGQTLSYANPGAAALTEEGNLSAPSGSGRQVYFVLRLDVASKVYLSMGVNVVTPGTTSFSLHLYVDANNGLSSLLPVAVFTTSTTAGTAGIIYITFAMSWYTLTAGQTYVMLIAPTSGESAFKHF